MTKKSVFAAGLKECWFVRVWVCNFDKALDGVQWKVARKSVDLTRNDSEQVMLKNEVPQVSHTTSVSGLAKKSCWTSGPTTSESCRP